jgi:hypothetical protein
MKEVIYCSCGRSDHVLLLENFENEKSIYMSVAKLTVPWYKRIVLAIKYALGFSVDNCLLFSEFVLDEESILKLTDFLHKVICDNLDDLPF